MRKLILAAALALANCAWALPSLGPALVVHDGTVGLEASVVTALSAKLAAAGYSVSTNVGVPGGSLSANKQIWDVRFNNTTPLTNSDISAYVAYMAAGGSLFVMGENTGFITRDNSIVQLVSAAGGGIINVTTPANLENVQSPFTGPNAVFHGHLPGFGRQHDRRHRRLCYKGCQQYRRRPGMGTQ
jgi:hypothetical protein